MFAAIGHWGGVDQGVWQFGVELFPTRFRALARGFTSSWIRLGAAISAVLTPILFSSIGFDNTMLIFAGVEIVVVALAFLLPEVNGRSLEEIGEAESSPDTGVTAALPGSL